jgi:hypothetical protein
MKTFGISHRRNDNGQDEIGEQQVSMKRNRRRKDRDNK